MSIKESESESVLRLGLGPWLYGCAGKSWRSGSNVADGRFLSDVILLALTIYGADLVTAEEERREEENMVNVYGGRNN